ncbi:WXG100-like domain-containing protein, partial [Streptomyces griseoloalbus]|uniref:WXG100-like domain-containing protein n=1 Tax=Streptomyces griseoloalbus TaxID=67303 RepID=UPI00402ADD72
MSIMPSPEVNAMIFILTGERLIDADEDLAFDSRRPYSGLGRKLDRISSLIDKSVHDIAESMPDDLAKSYAKAMGMLIDDGGKNYLREFAEQLDKIAEGRRKTSMDIMESKWQVIAEVIRLLIEIAIYLAMSFFTGGASASQIMMAKLRSRFMILTTLSHLLQRLHLAPSLTEAFAEAFTTFAVRLAMMNFAPDGRRPDGIDWSDIGKAAAFGAAAGGLTSIFDSWARNIVKSYDNNFLKDGPDLDFKNNPPNLKNDGPGPDLKNNGPNHKPNPDPTPGPNGPNDRPDPTPYDGGPNPTNTPTTFRNDPLSFRNNPNLWRNNQIWRNNADRPGALAGHYGLKGTADFLAAGSGEALAEILIKGAFDGDWSTSWTTFVGAGLSSQVEATLTDTAINSGAELRHAIDNLRNRPLTVSGGGTDADTRDSAGAPGSRDTDADGDGADRTGGPSGAGLTGGNGSALAPPPPVTAQNTGPQGDFTGSEAPPPYVAENPPPYSTPEPPPYTPGTLPVTAAENALWQQVHNGSAEVREQALRDIAALRGSPLPAGAEIGVRDGLHSSLSQLPEVRVVPAGNGPAAEIDADEVRRALDGFGTPVTVDTPLTGTSGGAGLGASGGAGLGASGGAGLGTSGGAGLGTSGGAGLGASGGAGLGASGGAGLGTSGGAGLGTSGGAGLGASGGAGLGASGGAGLGASGGAGLGASGGAGLGTSGGAGLGTS